MMPPEPFKLSEVVHQKALQILDKKFHSGGPSTKSPPRSIVFKNESRPGDLLLLKGQYYLKSVTSPL